MNRKALLALAVVAVWASAAQAQDAKFEIGGHVGWTISDGVTTDVGVIAGDGAVYNGIGPKDSFSWGLNAGVFVNENLEVGALWDRQMSTLELTGTRTFDVGDLGVDNYHGVFTYYFGSSDAKARPYVFGGAGATHFGAVPFTGLTGGARETQGLTKFSTTWGAGIKVFPSPKLALNLGARWTPTYIKSDDAGWWCDPYWGCYVLQDAQYSNQLSFSAGLSLRF